METEMLPGEGRSLYAIAKAGHCITQMSAAVKQLVGLLPNEAAALVRLSAASGQLARRAAFDDSSFNPQ